MMKLRSSAAAVTKVKLSTWNDGTVTVPVTRPVAVARTTACASVPWPWGTSRIVT
jgi:hypothetical protein